MERFLKDGQSPEGILATPPKYLRSSIGECMPRHSKESKPLIAAGILASINTKDFNLRKSTNLLTYLLVNF